MKDKTLMRNENGSVIVLAVIMLVLLTFLGISAIRTSTMQVQIAANEKRAVQNLYKAESGDHYALEIGSTWLTVAFLLANETASKIPNYTNDPSDPNFNPDLNPDLPPLDIDADGTNDVDIIKIRCIQDLDLIAAADNNLPVQPHKDSPPAGSGYSLKDYEIRRYGITATSTDGSSEVQIGIYKVFNKY